MDDPNHIQIDQPETEANIERPDTPKKNRTGLWIALGVTLVVLLAAAAFVGGRLMNQQAGEGGNQMIVTGPGMGMGKGDGPGLAVANGVQMKLEPAKEVPQTPPDAMGTLNSRDDNSLFLATAGGGAIGIMVSKDGETKVQTDQEGPEVEVVITKETKIYRDITGMSFNPGDGEENKVIEQKVEAITVDDISSSGLISVWGQKQGDRMIADIVFFMGG